jgi:acyl-CoA thioester hydrolase
MVKHRTKIRVRYADTDQMRVVYYGKFFEYFEQGRSDLFREVGFSYRQIEEMGFQLPVIEAHASYRRAARYDDLLTVTTILKEMPVVRVRIDYEVHVDGESDVLVGGYTIHSFVNTRTGKPTRAPAELLEALAHLMSRRESPETVPHV